MRIATEKIKNIDIKDENSLIVDFNEEDSTLIIKSAINPSIIDINFDELDNRLSNIEAQIKLRFQGEINVLKERINKLENGKVI